MQNSWLILVYISAKWLKFRSLVIRIFMTGHMFPMMPLLFPARLKSWLIICALALKPLCMPGGLSLLMFCAFLVTPLYVITFWFPLRVISNNRPFLKTLCSGFNLMPLTL